MRPGTDVFNDSPDRSDAKPGLGAMTPSDKEREGYPKRRFSNQMDKGAKVSTLFRKKVQLQSRERSYKVSQEKL